MGGTTKGRDKGLNFVCVRQKHKKRTLEMKVLFFVLRSLNLVFFAIEVLLVLFSKFVSEEFNEFLNGWCKCAVFTENNR